MDIRAEFLKFFEQKGHTLVPSAPLVPDDATLLFVCEGVLSNYDSTMFMPLINKVAEICGKDYLYESGAKVNGKEHQYCSIHCMIEEAVKNGKEVVDPQVVDNTTLKFIDANKAYYVVGSSKPATMSMVSKYAFGTKGAQSGGQCGDSGEIKDYCC